MSALTLSDLAAWLAPRLSRKRSRRFRALVFAGRLGADSALSTVAARALAARAEAVADPARCERLLALARAIREAVK